jgi:uncharacterized delta-60 repeat protein
MQIRRLYFEPLEDRRMLAVGDLDTTFDGDGKLTTDFGAFGDIAQSLAIQADGKIVVVGRSNIIQNNYDFALTRYNTNGSLDTSFSGDGKLTTAIGTGDDFGYDVAIQPDGKIVAVGSSSNAFAVVRYNTDGSLDTTFSGDGKQTTAIGTLGDTAQSVEIQADGKIVVAGYSNQSGSSIDFALVRYNADGSLDTSFSGDGMQTTAIGSAEDYLFGVAIQADGKIVVTGWSGVVPTSSSVAVARYNADGSLDTSFSGDGKLTTVIGSVGSSAYSVAIQADGKIVVAGGSSSGNVDFALVRYNTDGSLDTSFSGDGIVTTAVGSFNEQAYAVAIQPNGKIVAAGMGIAVNNFDFAVARYNTDGSLDTSFSGDGKQTTPFGTSDDRGFGMALQSDGKIVVAGRTDTGTPNGVNTDFAVARYEGDSIPALVGDYNRNDAVDPADYVMWRKTSGATGMPAYSGADGSGNSSVGNEDYVVWRAGFGQPTTGAASLDERSAGGPLITPGIETLSTSTDLVGVATESITLVARDSALAKPVAPEGDVQAGVWLNTKAKFATVSRLQQGTLTSTFSQRESRSFNDALLMWLASRDSQSDIVSVDTHVSTGGQDCLSHGEAFDGALDEMLEAGAVTGVSAFLP